MASLSTPTQCSALRKGGYVLIKEHPCKIVDMSTSKTGKHGGAKVHLVGIDIFTEKKCEDLCGSTQNVEVPTVERVDYQLIDIDGETLTYMDTAGETKSDLVLPYLCESDKVLAEEIKTKFDEGVTEGDIYLTVLSAMGTDAVKAWRIQK